MATLRSLEGRLRRVNRRLENGLTRLMAELGKEVGRTLVEATPVDTGFARANWRPTLNVPAGRPVTFLDPTGAATSARIAAIARSWKVGDTIYIVNNAPYIGLLNRGSSPQAPANFVKDTVDSATSRVLASFRGGLVRAGR